MQEGLVETLRTRRSQIRERWSDLLRADRANTPLANPDMLVHMLDWTLDEIFRGLARLASRRRSGRHVTEYLHKPECPCGRNPLLVYFAVGEQALQEALILVQAEAPALSPLERDISLEELNLVLQHISGREIEAFCGVCQFRTREGTAACTTPAMAESHAHAHAHMPAK